MEGATAKQLLDAGILEVCEPGDVLACVALRTESLTEEDVRLLVRSYGPSSTIITSHVQMLLRGVAPRFVHDPELARQIQFVLKETDDRRSGSVASR